MIWVPDSHWDFCLYSYLQKTNVDSKHYFRARFAGSKDDVNGEDVGSRGDGGIGGCATFKMLHRKRKKKQFVQQKHSTQNAIVLLNYLKRNCTATINAKNKKSFHKKILKCKERDRNFIKKKVLSQGISKPVFSFGLNRNAIRGNLNDYYTKSSHKSCD